MAAMYSFGASQTIKVATHSLGLSLYVWNNITERIPTETDVTVTVKSSLFNQMHKYRLKSPAPKSQKTVKTRWINCPCERASRCCGTSREGGHIWTACSSLGQYCAASVWKDREAFTERHARLYFQDHSWIFTWFRLYRWGDNWNKSPPVRILLYR